MPSSAAPLIAEATALPKLQAPIVLVHGFFGFNQVTVAGVTVAQYFPGIAEVLRRAGNRVHIPGLSPTKRVAERAAELKRYLERHVPDEPVHLIAHSMGGLDSRWMISRLGMAHRVLSLTTLGTPHRGSPFADWAIRHLERLVKPVLSLLSIPIEGVYDLTTTACCRFHEQVADAANVRYFSIAGEHRGLLSRPEWLLPYSVVHRAEGPNDGVVSVTSAQHGECLGVWPLDHLSLVNWTPTPVHTRPLIQPGGLAVFTPLLQRLARDGF